MKGIFFIIGAQRCGTTYLYRQLDSHPQISMAKPVYPEPKYFISNALYNKEDYLNTYFPNTSTDQVFGEKSTSYIEYPNSAEQILSIFPCAKFLAVLRNPVERAISNYFFSKKNGLEKRTLKEVFLDRDTDINTFTATSVSPFNYLKRGHYHQYLESYTKVIGRDRFKILLFENIINHAKALQETYGFLEVDGSFISPDFGKKVNDATNPQLTSNDIYNKLYLYYEYHNQQLSEKFNLNIDVWAQ